VFTFETATAASAVALAEKSLRAKSWFTEPVALAYTI